MVDISPCIFKIIYFQIKFNSLEFHLKMNTTKMIVKIIFVIISILQFMTSLIIDVIREEEIC